MDYESNKMNTKPVTTKCYLFSIYFVLQTNKSQTIYTSVVLFQNTLYAVILPTSKNLLSKGAELPGINFFEIFSSHLVKDTVPEIQ